MPGHQVRAIRESTHRLRKRTQRCTQLHTRFLPDLIQELGEAHQISGLTADGVVGFAREIVGENTARRVLIGELANSARCDWNQKTG